jgi:lysophospholipase L1-like esterase
MLEMTWRYVALGDSYTIGTAVAPGERWPDLLVGTLGRGSNGLPRLELVANLAANGRTSRDVLRSQLPRLGALAPGFVSLLIGVNDVVQGVSADGYRDNVAATLGGLLTRLPPGRVLTVTTPDYTVTPAGAGYGDPTTQRAQIVRNNSILADLAAGRGIVLVDIFDLSRRAASDRSLVAHDGLHPSARQYRLWVERIGPIVARLLEGEA